MNVPDSYKHLRIQHKITPPVFVNTCKDKGRIVILTKEGISSISSSKPAVNLATLLLSSPAMMRSVTHQSRPLMGLHHPIQISRHSNYPQKLPHRITPYTNGFQALRAAAQSQETHLANNREKRIEDDDGIPLDLVKVLVKFKSRYNYIRVLEVSRRADHQFAGSRLLLLDTPGNIHSVSFLLKFLTETYLDVFAIFPPILPPGPLGILGFGAGSAARLILELYPQAVIHGWELDPSVISVGREYFGVSELEKKNPDRLFIYEGDALEATVTDGFAGVLVDLFCKGSLIPELQDSRTWEKLKGCLKKGGRIMVNLGGSCVESEDPQRDGKLVMEESLKAMNLVFPGQMFVLNLGRRKEDSSLALTGDLPDIDAWMQSLPMSLRGYASMWSPFSCAHFL